LNHYGRPFVVVKNLPPEEFEKHSDQFPGRADYSPNLQTLILNLPSWPHEQAAGLFSALLTSKSSEMAVFWDVSSRGSTLVTTSERSKQADCSWSPLPDPQGRSGHWPTVVLEVAWFESLEKVKRDVAWWLNKLNGEVKMVITIDIKHPSGNIYINTWERAELPTSANPNPEPCAVQEVKIFRHLRSAIGDHLVIPFRDLMLRPAVGPTEGNWVFPREELLKLADRVWYAMDHM
jgi:hypothetical protein